MKLVLRYIAAGAWNWPLISIHCKVKNARSYTSTLHTSLLRFYLVVAIIISKDSASWPVTSSDMKHLWGLGVTRLFAWASYQPVAKLPVLEEQGFLPSDRLPNMAKSPACPPRNPAKGALTRASRTCNSHKAGLPHPVSSNLLPFRFYLFIQITFR
jgi:hypothetical protein